MRVRAPGGIMSGSPTGRSSDFEPAASGGQGTDVGPEGKESAMLEGHFSNNWRSFARQYAMLPGDAARGYRPDPNTETQLDGVFEGFRHTQMSPGQKIATVTMTKGPTSRGDAVSVRASLAGAGLPVYFLPWDARGAAVEMTIPSRNPDLPERTHPRFFFTAVLSGCSVFFRGNRQYPTIYHCGTSGKTGGGAPTEGESNAFFDRLLKTARFLGVGARPSGRAKMVRSTDYRVTKASGASPELEQLTDEVLEKLRRHYAGRVLVESATSWGMVFGVRAERDWTFYLQRNCTIVHKMWEDVEREVQIRKKIWRGLRTKTITRKYITRGLSGPKAKAVPVSLTQVFPGGGHTMNMTDSLRYRL